MYLPLKGRTREERPAAPRCVRAPSKPEPPRQATPLGPPRYDARSGPHAPTRGGAADVRDASSAARKHAPRADAAGPRLRDANKAHPLQYSAGGSSSGLPEQALHLAKIFRVLLHDVDAAEPRGCTAGLAPRRYAAAHEHACSRAGIFAKGGAAFGDAISKSATMRTW